MNKDKLKDILLRIKAQKEKEEKVKTVFGFDVMIAFYDKHWEILDILLKEILTKEQYEEVNWWLYEDVEKYYTKDGVKVNVENVDDFLNFIENEFKIS